MVERQLGEGGMGVVYLATDRERSMQVALKTLRDREPASLARFKREFRSLADVAHPGLVDLYELFASDDGLWFFTMEAVEGVHFDVHVGCSISDMADTELPATRIELEERSIHRSPTKLEVDLEHEPVPAPAVVHARLDSPVADLRRLTAALAQLTEAIEVLHQAGMTHCDLKPSNVLVTPEGRVVLLDFGLTRARVTHGEAPSNLEGTPHYIAPELVHGALPSPASDWYAVGVMLFRALTGRLPVIGDSSRQLFSRMLREELPKVASLVDNVPRDLAHLVDGLLAKEPSERLSGQAVRDYLSPRRETSAAPNSSEPAFVGRGAELAELARCFEQAAGGAPTFVVVKGPSGIGKSALVRHFGAMLSAERRALVIGARCYEREQVPFKALDGIVDALAAHLVARHDAAALLPSGAAALAVLFPVLLAVPAIAKLPPLDPSLDPTSIRALATEAIPVLFARLSAERPLVIIVDDLQWGDLDSAALLADVIDPNSRTPFLFLASVRSDTKESDIVRAIRTRARRLVDIEVGALPHDECVALARAVAGSEAEAEAIARDAKGLPFFAVELARWSGREDARGGASTPRSVDEVIDARAADVPEDARKLLEISALAGVPLTGSVLASAAGLFTDPLPHLRFLNARSLLRTSSLETHEVETYHDRVREVVAGRIEPQQRRSLHARLGAVLAEVENVDPELVARHFTLGGQVRRARPFVVVAAARAAAALAFDHAVTLYQSAYDNAEADERGTASLELAEALVRAGRSAEAAPLFAARAREAGTEIERTHARRRAAAEWLKCGLLDQGIDELREVLRGVGLRYPDSQAEAFVRAATRIVRIQSWDGHFTPRDEAQIGAEVLARVDAVRAAGIGFMLVDPLRGYGFLARFLLDARASGEPRRIAAGLAFNSVTLCRGGRAGFPKAQRWLSITRDIAERLDDDYLRGLADSCEAGVRICTGEWRMAARLGAAGTPRLRAAPTSATWELTAVRAVQRAAMFFSGELRAMREECTLHLRAAEAVGDHFAATYARVHRWIEPAMDDDVARGRRDLAAAMSTWSSLGFHAMHLWALFGELQYDLYEGNALAGLERLERARTALSRSRILQMQIYRVWLRATEANLLLAAGRQRAAMTVARELDGERQPYATAFATLVRARLHQNDNPILARAESATAARLFANVDMSMHAAGARALHGTLLGSDAGKAARTDAESTIAAQGVKRPDRWLSMLGVR